MSVYDYAKEYLLSFPAITPDILDRHLTLWNVSKKNSLEEIYKSFLNHAKNRNALPNTIGNIDNLAGILFGFNPVEVSRTYFNGEGILRAIIDAGIQTPAPIDIANQRSHWVIYAKSVISSAKFLERFNSAEEFHNFVESFYCNEYSRLALPLLLKEEIFGFGFALACDFLKENGYNGFVKPDTHIKVICRAFGISESNTDFGVFKDVVLFCDQNNLIPYEFDKIIWLVGSGSFYLDNIQVGTSRTDFITRNHR